MSLHLPHLPRPLWRPSPAGDPAPSATQTPATVQTTEPLPAPGTGEMAQHASVSLPPPGSSATQFKDHFSTGMTENGGNKIEIRVGGAKNSWESGTKTDVDLGNASATVTHKPSDVVPDWLGGQGLKVELGGKTVAVEANHGDSTFNAEAGSGSSYLNLGVDNTFGAGLQLTKGGTSVTFGSGPNSGTAGDTQLTIGVSEGPPGGALSVTLGSDQDNDGWPEYGFNVELGPYKFSYLSENHPHGAETPPYTGAEGTSGKDLSADPSSDAGAGGSSTAINPVQYTSLPDLQPGSSNGTFGNDTGSGVRDGSGYDDGGSSSAAGAAPDAKSSGSSSVPEDFGPNSSGAPVSYPGDLGAGDPTLAPMPDPTLAPMPDPTLAPMPEDFGPNSSGAPVSYPGDLGAGTWAGGTTTGWTPSQPASDAGAAFQPTFDAGSTSFVPPISTGDL